LDYQSQIGGVREQKITGTKQATPGVPPPIPLTKDEVADKFEITTGSREEKYNLGNYKQTLLAGDHDTTITLGNDLVEVATGDITHKTTVKGDIINDVFLKNSVGIKNNVTTGDIQSTVATGNIKETITTKGDKTTDITTAGNIKETILTGDKTTDITTGSIKETIFAGSKEVTITTGDFKVTITGGNVEIKTELGSVKIGTKSDVTIEGLLGVTIKGGVKISNLAAMVELGNSPARGGVVTGLPVPSHLDFLTGLPLVSSKTVMAAI